MLFCQPNIDFKIPFQFHTCKLWLHNSNPSAKKYINQLFSYVTWKIDISSINSICALFTLLIVQTITNNNAI